MTIEPMNPKVSEKLREDIREIQLQLAGLEIEEPSPSPYRTELMEESEEVPVSAEEQAISDSELLAQMELDQAMGEVPADAEITDLKAFVKPGEKLIEDIKKIPNTMAFKIGEAADLVGVKQYVLRYWETEFDQLKPKKSKNGQRVYSRKEIEMALMIKKLLYDDRFSIEGARAALKTLKQEVKEEKAVIEIAERDEQAQRQLLEQAKALLGRLARARERIERFQV